MKLDLYGDVVNAFMNPNTRPMSWNTLSQNIFSQLQFIALIVIQFVSIVRDFAIISIDIINDYLFRNE